LLHRLYGFVRCPDRVCEKRVIDERRRIVIAPIRVPWRGRRIFDDGDLETLLEQFAQVRFDAHIGEHSAQNDLADFPFAELQNEVVGLRPPHAVRRDDDGFAILDVGLKALQPIRPDPSKPSRVNTPWRANIPEVASLVSSGPLNFHPLSVG
jgi:hypothetical protein